MKQKEKGNTRFVGLVQAFICILIVIVVVNSFVVPFIEENTRYHPDLKEIKYEDVDTLSSTPSRLFMFVTEECPGQKIQIARDLETVFIRCPHDNLVAILDTHLDGESNLYPDGLKMRRSKVIYVPTNQVNAVIFRSWWDEDDEYLVVDVSWLSDDGMELLTWDRQNDILQHWIAVEGFSVTEKKGAEGKLQMWNLRIDPTGGHRCVDTKETEGVPREACLS